MQAHQEEEDENLRVSKDVQARAVKLLQMRMDSQELLLQLLLKFLDCKASEEERDRLMEIISADETGTLLVRLLL